MDLLRLQPQRGLADLESAGARRRRRAGDQRRRPPGRRIAGRETALLLQVSEARYLERPGGRRGGKPGARESPSEHLGAAEGWHFLLPLECPPASPHSIFPLP